MGQRQDFMTSTEEAHDRKSPDELKLNARFASFIQPFSPTLSQHNRKNCQVNRQRNKRRPVFTCCASNRGRGSQYPVGKHGAPSQVYVPDTTFASGISVQLSNRELSHLRARRVRNGTSITLFNGRGETASATFKGNEALVHQVNAACNIPNLSVASKSGGEESEKRTGIHVVVSLLKSPSRTDWLVEKLTELNASSISFTTMRRTLPGCPGEDRVKRWERVAVAAVKQCARSDVPAVRWRTWDDCLKMVVDFQAAFVLCADGQNILDIGVRNQVVDADGVVFVVGPEGGLEEAEIKAMTEAGAQRVGLGSLRLRVETAAMVATSVVGQILNVKGDDMRG